MGKGYVKDEGEDKPCSANAISQPVNSPIDSRNTGKGNPNAILHFGRPLNNRQQKLLDSLPTTNSRVIVNKDDVNMTDLSALTAITEMEFALFTKGNERLIIRGNETKVDINEEDAKQLYLDGYTWSGHTHPGVTEFCMEPSDGDIRILRAFNQEESVIYNSKGQHRIFTL